MEVRREVVMPSSMEPTEVRDGVEASGSGWEGGGGVAVAQPSPTKSAAAAPSAGPKSVTTLMTVPNGWRASEPP